MRKVGKRGCYKVMNKKTKRVFAKCTSKENAKKQLKLLRAIQYNKDFVLRPQPPASSRKTRRVSGKQVSV